MDPSAFFFRMPYVVTLLATCAMIHTGLPGPNSRTTDWFLGPFNGLDATENVGSRGEGSHSSMWIGGEACTQCNVSGPFSKRNGQGHVGSYGSGPMPVIKRSLRRAHHRALRDGWCMYRGRILMPDPSLIKL